MSPEKTLPPRYSRQFDVVIVGAGPSGLAPPLRLSSQRRSHVVVVGEGSEVGAHIFVWRVIDPVALDK